MAERGRGHHREPPGGGTRHVRRVAVRDFLAGPGGECLYINPTTERITGLDARGRDGTRLDVRPASRRLRAHHHGMELRGRGPRRVPDVDRPLRSPNGKVREVEVRALPLAGQTTDDGFVGILEDVSERLAAEAERTALLTRAQEARIEAEAARAEVASILSRISDAFMARSIAPGASRTPTTRPGAHRPFARGADRPTLQELEPQPLGDAFTDAYRGALAGQRRPRRRSRPRATAMVRSPHLPVAHGRLDFFEDVSDHRLREEQLATDRDYLRQELGRWTRSPKLSV